MSKITEISLECWWFLEFKGRLKYKTTINDYFWKDSGYPRTQTQSWHRGQSLCRGPTMTALRTWFPCGSELSLWSLVWLSAKPFLLPPCFILANFPPAPLLFICLSSAWNPILSFLCMSGHWNPAQRFEPDSRVAPSCHPVPVAWRLPCTLQKLLGYQLPAGAFPATPSPRQQSAPRFTALQGVRSV